MENYVSAQLLLLGQAALLGMLGGVVYDLLRPLRRGRLIHLTDALFTGGGLVLMVWFLTAVSRGEARLFLLLGACGGAGLYFLLLAPLLWPLWDFWAAAAAAFGRLLALPLHFGVKLAKKIGNSMKKHFLFWKKYATMKQYRWEYPHLQGAGKETAMARKKNTKKRRSGLLGALVLLILLGVMAYKLVEVYGDLSVGKEREARLRTQKEQKQEEVNSLKDALSHADDPDYILGLARDRLGLVEDGERIFRDVNN